MELEIGVYSYIKFFIIFSFILFFFLFIVVRFALCFFVVICKNFKFSLFTVIFPYIIILLNNDRKKSALSHTDPLGGIWTAPLDVQKYQRKIPLRLLRWMSKRYGLMRRHIFWDCFLPLQFFTTNSI